MSLKYKYSKYRSNFEVRNLLVNRFKPFLANYGIELLRDDYLFLEAILLKIPKNERRSVLMNYFKKVVPMHYLDKINERTPIGLSHADVLKGRIRANTWIRENYSD